ncbi:ATP6 synthase, partial [Acromyrmex heyeri]
LLPPSLTLLILRNFIYLGTGAFFSLHIAGISSILGTINFISTISNIPGFKLISHINERDKKETFGSLGIIYAIITIEFLTIIIAISTGIKIFRIGVNLTFFQYFLGLRDIPCRYSYLNNYLNNLLARLTRLSTLFILIPFTVIIESISLIIRPFILTIRLTTNIIAEHLLLGSLLGSSGINIFNPAILLILISTQILLYILEISVSIIQAYIFSNLLFYCYIYIVEKFKL